MLKFPAQRINFVIIINNIIYSVNQKILTSNYPFKNHFLLKIKKPVIIVARVSLVQWLASFIVVRFINLEAISVLASCWLVFNQFFNRIHAKEINTQPAGFLAKPAPVDLLISFASFRCC